jgi:general stress protein 26
MNNEQNLTGTEAVEKLRGLIKGSSTGMFATRLTSVPFHVCPMQVQQVDDEGALWFFSGADSAHNAHIAADPRVQVIFTNTSDYEFLTVFGRAEIRTDRAKIEELWDATVKAWFPKGKDDPNLSLIRLAPEDAHYWDTKNGKVITLIKMIAAAASNREPDAGVQGDLKV